jgi:hypothetical protein
MRTILFLIGLFIININLYSNTPKNQIQDWKDVKNMEDVRLCRFTTIPTRSYREDTDSQIIGSTNIYFKLHKDKKEKLQKNKINNKQTTKFKSTYLDFTILTEENIS